VRAPESSSRRRDQAGFFLIEAMVALLIFALGILGLVAMGGTAVASQSDAQYRTEASAIADAIAGEIALSVNRLPGPPPITSAQNKAASLLAFAHHPAGGNCVFGGAATLNASVAALADRAGNAIPGAQGLPGATTVNQQVRIGGAAQFNRVEITLCWRTANDNAMRRHTLVTYIN
jgi:type IV pilus assembly protein PilV